MSHKEQIVKKKLFIIFIGLITACIIYYIHYFSNNIIYKKTLLEAPRGYKQAVKTKRKIPDNKPTDFSVQEAPRYRDIHVSDKINNLYPDNYISQILSHGNLIRWHHKSFPLKVYIEPNPTIPASFKNMVKDAFIEWQSKAGEIISFKFVDSYRTADIICRFPADFNKRIRKDSNTAGITFPNIKDNKLQYMTIELQSLNNDKFVDTNSLKSTILHEIGHALGLTGHSENKNDVMYPLHTKPIKISRGDINTLKLLYAIIPDISNMDYDESYRNKFWTTDDILGNTNQRIDIEIQSKLRNIQNIGDEKQPSLLTSLGDSYLAKKDYKNAIEYYKQALIQLGESNKIQSSNIFFNIALCYIKINDKANALKFAKYSFELNPQKKNKELIHALNNNYTIEIKE